MVLTFSSDLSVLEQILSLATLFPRFLRFWPEVADFESSGRWSLPFRPTWAFSLPFRPTWAFLAKIKKFLHFALVSYGLAPKWRTLSAWLRNSPDSAFYVLRTPSSVRAHLSPKQLWIGARSTDRKLADLCGSELSAAQIGHLLTFVDRSSAQRRSETC